MVAEIGQSWSIIKVARLVASFTLDDGRGANVLLDPKASDADVAADILESISIFFIECFTQFPNRFLNLVLRLW